MTVEQDVVKIRAELGTLRAAMVAALKKFHFIPRDSVSEKFEALIDYQQKAVEYFNGAERFVGDSELLGARESKHWAQGFAEDCYAILESMIDHFVLLRLEFGGHEVNPESYEPTKTAYANMQRMVAQYLPSKKESLHAAFKDQNLPIYGFENKAKNFMVLDKILAFVFGVTFIVAMCLAAVFIPQPSAFQYKVFQTVLSLAGAGIGAVLPGFLEIKSKGWLRAGGALAILILFYLWNPANLVVQAQG